MSNLPYNLYRAAQVRELDRLVIERFEVSANVLMERAGEAAFNVLKTTWPKAKHLAVLCGTGNNGGDGFVLARLAQEAGIKTAVYQIGDATKLKGDALAAAQRLQNVDITPTPYETQDLSEQDVIVDALLGTGLRGNVSDEWHSIIQTINQSSTPVLALDIPSGLHSDTGMALGVAVRAASTISFIGLKQGLLTGDGPDYCGALHFDDLKAPKDIYNLQPAASTRLDYASFKSLLTPRKRTAHKGEFGHVLIIGGDSGMTGAARMAGESAARIGAGLVSIATRESHAAMLNAARPELMGHGIETEEDFTALAQQATMIAIGPGLRQSEWSHLMFNCALNSDLPLLVDADALNLLAKTPRERENWILTPHPGEAARLLDCSTKELQNDRFDAIQQIQERYGGIIVLKGAGTLVKASHRLIGVCDAGNPGMATGGMGDVLTGVIAGLVAQGLKLSEAARLGVCLHAEAGDEAAKAVGERGLLASDLMPWVRRLANPHS